MKYLVTGVCGQLGYDCAAELLSRGYGVVGSDIFPAAEGECVTAEIAGTHEVPGAYFSYMRLDITDASAVTEAVGAVRPDCVVHCAAWTAVDDAEDPANRDRVRAVNVLGTRNIAQAARKADAKMVYLSTDYVFGGSGTAPWEPDCKEFHPLNVYGSTKLEGEDAVWQFLKKFFIVRTSWVFGLHGSNFVSTMIRAGRKYDQVRVVCDQTGTPTYTPDLARLIADLTETERYGFYHATNSETEPGAYISWYEFCREIYRQCGIETRVVPVTTEEYGLSAAKRPHNSRLDKTKLSEAGLEPLPSWRDALCRFLEDLPGSFND